MPKKKTVPRGEDSKVISRKEWLAARLKLLKAEKERNGTVSTISVNNDHVEK